MTKKVLLVFKTPILKCPRPRRLYLELSKKHQCSYLCPAALDEKADHQRRGFINKQVQSPFVRWLNKIAVKFGVLWLAEKLEVRRYQLPRINDGEFDIIFVHDLFLLPHFSHFNKSKIIFDAREYYPLEFSDDAAWQQTRGKLSEYVCRKHMPLAHKLLTVSPTIARWYETLVNKKVYFFPSYPRQELLFEWDDRREISYPIRFIHHGNAFKNRGLEKMIHLMHLLGGNYQLDLMLVTTPSNAYFDKLKKLSEEVPNVRIIAPVHPDEIIKYCSSYDAGLYLLEVNNSQNKHCLPNKYFEFLYAGLPVITSFSEDMKTLTNQYGTGIGFSEESIDEIAHSILNLTPEDFVKFRSAIRDNIHLWNLANNVKENLPELR